MNEVEALDLLRRAFWTILVASGPSVGAAMVVGIAVALVQALTQIQEMTLTFIPKIVVILAVIMMTAPFMGGTVHQFAEEIYGRVETGF